MIIDHNTKTEDVLPLLNDERLEYIIKEIPAMDLRKSLLSMTIREYFDAIDDKYVDNLFKENEYAYVFFGRLKQYRAEIEQINKFMKVNEIEETAEQKQAKFGVNFPSWQQSVLIELTKFYGFKSIEEAGNVAVSEWLMIHRYNSANAKYEYNYNKIMSAKNKMK